MEKAVAGAVLALAIATMALGYVLWQTSANWQTLQSEVARLNQDVDNLSNAVTNLQWPLNGSYARINGTAIQSYAPRSTTPLIDTTINGSLAWQVCADFRLPCPSNPEFQAKTNVNGSLSTYFVTVHINNVPWYLVFNDSWYCISPPFDSVPGCP
jgi:hypothetical protein